MIIYLDVLGEPLVEPQVRVEQRRHDEVQQRPQLGHAVLNAGKTTVLRYIAGYSVMMISEPI